MTLEASDKERLYDILDVCDRIKQYANDGSRDQKTADAVMYRIAVIGEATTHLSDTVKDQFPDIPWVEMRGIRNIIVHDYAGVSEKRIWQVVESDIPALHQRIEHILR